MFILKAVYKYKRFRLFYLEWVCFIFDSACVNWNSGPGFGFNRRTTSGSQKFNRLGLRKDQINMYSEGMIYIKFQVIESIFDRD